MSRWPSTTFALLVSWLSMASVGTGCSAVSEDAVSVTISFTEKNPARQLTGLTLISGGDKYSWPILAAGETRNVNLMPGPRDDRQLTLLYYMEAERKSWEGPKIPVATGYRIDIKVDAAGSVAHRHCIRPCSLH